MDAEVIANNVSLSDDYLDEDVSENASRDAHEQLNHNMTMAVLPVTVFIGLEFFIGLFGNILIILIYTLHYRRSTFRCLILTMAIIDLTSCMTTLPGEIFSQMNWYSYEYDWICKIKSTFNVMTAFSSAEILLILAFDRYRKVCRPLAWQIHPSLAMRLCCGSLVIGVIAASPALVLWGRQDYTYVAGAVTINVSICEKSSQYADEIYPFLYITFIYILPLGVMMLVICGLNILTTKTLFCGMGDLTKETIYKNASVSTLQSTVSFSRNMSALPNVKIRSTDIDVWVGTNSQVDSLWVNDITISVNTGQHAKDVHKNIVGESNKTKVNQLETTDQQNDQPYVNDMNINTERVNSLTKSDFKTRTGSVIEKTNDLHTKNADEETEQVASSGKSHGRAKTSSSFSDSSDVTPDSRGSLSCLEKGRRFEAAEQRRKRKTLIMLVLTSVFIVTMLMYIIMTSIVAGADGTLRVLSNSGKTAFFFFWRLYFINCVVNPVLYGFVDPRFCSGLRKLFTWKRRLICCSVEVTVKY